MNKTELLAESVRAGLVVHKSWSIEELRAILREHRESNKELDGKTAMRGPAGMTLPQLKAKADIMDVKYPNAITKRNLLRLIRDSVNTPANELMTFGKYRGYEFQEVPASYGEWAVAEVNKSDNASADLIRFAKRYHKERTMKNMQTYGVKDLDDSTPYHEEDSSIKSGYMSLPTDSRDSRPLTSWNTEGPIITSPGRNHKGKAASSSTGSWEAVASTPQRSGKGNQKTATPKRTKANDEDERNRNPMDSEVDPAVLEEIQILQTRLALLKDKAKSPGH